jgi:Rrf2 family iron-sulfur cluster assembly transcriptional regulator
MKISAQEEYGLRCLLQLARADAEGESLTLSQIARREGISSANAGKLMWILNKAGLVQSQRGTKGGYRLARPAAQIHLNEVISVLDDERVETHCQSYSGVLEACVHTGDCGIRPVIVELHQVVDSALSEITLSQLLGTEANVDAVLHQIQGAAGKRGPTQIQA